MTTENKMTVEKNRTTSSSPVYPSICCLQTLHYVQRRRLLHIKKSSRSSDLIGPEGRHKIPFYELSAVFFTQEKQSKSELQ